MKQKKVTFADIAAYTGFSKTTISRYFNNPDSLTLENQEKITHALDVLGYQENKLAKVLANGKSEFVGIIIPNLYLHYYSEMLNQLLSTYEKYNYKFLVFIGDRFLDALHQLFGTDKDARRAAVRYLLQLGLGWVVGMVASVAALAELFAIGFYMIPAVKTC